MFFTTFILLFLFLSTFLRNVYSMFDDSEMYRAQYSAFGITPCILQEAISKLNTVPCKY